MAVVKPFRALQFTPAAGEIAALTCPPYDIISEEQRAAFLRQNPHNVIRLELPREGENPYAVAAETLAAWQAEGKLKQYDVPAFYLYAIDFTVDGKEYNIAGIVGAVQLSPFSEGVVLPHEYTLSKAKADRFELMKATACNFSNIYSLYQDGDNKLDVMTFADTATAVFDMVDEAGLRHRLWAIENEADCERLTAHFADKKLYIADGHHRYETAIHYRDWRRENGTPVGAPSDSVMMMLVEMSHPGLVVFPTHRLVRNLPQADAAALLKACEGQFAVETVAPADFKASLDAAYAQGKTAFGFYAKDAAALLTLKDDTAVKALLPELSAASQELDVTVLHTLILEQLLKIDKEDMAAQRSLTYTRDMAEAIASVDNGDSQYAFLLNPTRVSEIGAVASAGEKMPQKSTYFYPKLITGLTMRWLEQE